MRRNRRVRWHRRDDNDYYHNGKSYNRILLEEFRFHNKQKQVINDKILIDIKKRLLAGEKKIYWTNKIFASYMIGFAFTTFNKTITSVGKTDKTIKSCYIEIIEFPFIFTEEQFNKCKLIHRNMFITYDLTEEQQQLLNDLDLPTRDNNDNNDKHITEILFKTLDSWNDIINHLITKKHLKRYNYSQHDDWKKFNKDLMLLFNETVERKSYNIDKRGWNSISHHIIKVIEKRIDEKNYRIAITALCNKNSPEHYIKITSEDDKEYNYIDENRIYLSDRSDKYFLDITTNEYTASGKVIIHNELYEQILRNVNDILGDGIIINPQIYRFYKERVVRWEDDEVLPSKEILIVEQYKKLLKQRGKVTIGDVLISENEISIVGESFCLKFAKGFINTHKDFPKIKQALKVGDARYNFNILFENLLKLSKLKIIRMDYTKEEEYKTFNSTSFTLNGMYVAVTKNGSKIRINDIFCRIDDVQHILSKMICYSDINEFNKYVKEVSHIGIEWKKMISNGITIELDNPLHSLYAKTGTQAMEKMFMRFSLLWDAEHRSNIYLLLNKQRYLIRYKGKFKQYFNLPNRMINMENMRNELMECLYEIDDEIILEIVENAVEEAKIIKQRGEELVSNTVKEISAKESEIDIRGNKSYGFTFTGRVSGNIYFVNKISLEVYRKEGASWNRRCVVDDHTKQRIFEDRLANRLVNIYNEPVKIFTLHN